MRASDPMRLLSCMPASMSWRAIAAIHIHAGDDQRPEEIAFAAFIDAEVRLEHFRRMHFFVTKLRFAENFRLELETARTPQSPCPGAESSALSRKPRR